MILLSFCENYYLFIVILIIYYTFFTLFFSFSNQISILV
jgi:hypothetical protein